MLWRVLLFLMVLLPLIVAAEENTIENAVVNEYRSANLKESVDLLVRLRHDSPGIFKAKHFDYLLGRAAEKLGDHALAMSGYLSASRRDSPLREYALYRMSRLAAASGDRISERLYLTELTIFFPDSLLIHAAETGIVHSYFHSSNYKHASQTQPSAGSSAELSASIASNAEIRTLRGTQIIRCRSLQELGELEDARKCYVEVLNTTADAGRPDDFALDAVRGLDVIDRAQKNLRLSAEEHMRRGRVYQFNREFVDARGHFTAVVDEYSSDASVTDAIFNIARGYALRSEFSDAAVWFERLLEQYPEDALVGDALLNAASAYSRNGKFREAIARYQMFIDRFPKASNLDRAYLNPIDILRDHNLYTDALRRSAEAQQMFRGKPAESQALFVEARIHLAKENWSQALDSFERLLKLSDLGGANLPGGTTTEEIKFLRALTLEKMNEIPQAISGYLSITDGRNEYYGWRATERLRELATNEKTQAFIEAAKAPLLRTSLSNDPEIRRTALQSLIRMTANEQQQTNYLTEIGKLYSILPLYSAPIKDAVDAEDAIDSLTAELENANDRHSKLAGVFIKLGLYDDAAAEYEAASKIAKRNNNVATAALYDRGNKAYRGIAFMEPKWRNVPADFQVELIPHGVARSLYPVPYADSVTKHSADKKVDPRFILSIMRQESRFRPDVRSIATARGLMQFIPATADQMADQLKITGFVQDDLYDPDTAILFGSQYSGELLKMFPNQYQAVAASYNGGEDNMRRWYGRASSDDPDRYVAEIAFAQSKDYVFKVMANYRVYKALFSEDLKPK